MNSALPEVFLPNADSEAVKKLKTVLKTENEAVRVPVVSDASARENECYPNVRERLKNLLEGKMQLGWAVWQHSNLFVEAEPHAILDPGNGQPWIDCTPHMMPDRSSAREILFIPDYERTYNFNTTDVLDNVRVPLMDDPRLKKALDLFAQRTALLNTIPGIGHVSVPIKFARKIAAINLEASSLLTELVEPSSGQGLRISAQAESRSRKIGRNDPCPCGSGKKYKKCCGNPVH